MSDAFLAEIRIFAGSFAPTGWAFCNGQLLPVTQNTALFSLLGVTYGGDGRVTFALPDLRGASPMHAGQGPGLADHPLGDSGGSATVTLVGSEMPVHRHTARAVAAKGDRNAPAGAVWAEGAVGRVFDRGYAPAGTVPLHPAALGTVGGGQPHENMPPYLTLSFIIALQGIFPPHP